MKKEEKIISLPFYFIRHGETDWNRKGCIMGHRDIPLNSLGIEQAHQAAGFLDNLGLEHIVSSPLRRALQTAEIINSYLKLPMSIHDGLKEWGWGVKEGTVQLPEQLKQWAEGMMPEGAEIADAFQGRAVSAVNDILSQGQKTLFVAHGGIHWALRKALGYPDGRIENCIAYLFKPPEQGILPWIISSVKDVE